VVMGEHSTMQQMQLLAAFLVNEYARALHFR